MINSYSICYTRNLLLQAINALKQYTQKQYRRYMEHLIIGFWLCQ